MVKKDVFLRCDRCIGITPCTRSKNGKYVCSYCRHEIKTPSTRAYYLAKNPTQEEARL